MNPSSTLFSICFQPLPRPVVDVWDTIVAVLNTEKMFPKKFLMSQIAGHRAELQAQPDLTLDAEGVREVILTRDLDGFRVCNSYADSSVAFVLANIQNTGSPAVLHVELGSKAKGLTSWNRLIEGLAVQWRIIGAWQWNHLYVAWQNTRNLSVYERRCGAIPPNAERYESQELSGHAFWIRLQNAPGRTKNLLPAVDVPITAEMWLGPGFWQYAPCTKANVLGADFFMEVRDTADFLYLKSWPEPFVRPDGEQGRIQRRLWRLLFHEDCEWPPGSGTIQDEPVYGPPELMPEG